MAKFDFVYFDLDDTLLDHRNAERQALSDVVTEFPQLRHLDIESVRKEYHTINGTLWRRYAAGAIDRDTLRIERFAKLIEAFEIQKIDSAELGERYMLRYSDHWQLIDGAMAALQEIANAVRVGLITNGFAEVQRNKLSRFPQITQVLSATVISEEVGVMKPHPALFTAARRAAESDGAILYVGDSFHSDVVGALGAGWSVAWYRPWPTSDGDNRDEDETALEELLAGQPVENGSSAMRFTDWHAFTQFTLERV